MSQRLRTKLLLAAYTILVATIKPCLRFTNRCDLLIESVMPANLILRIKDDAMVMWKTRACERYKTETSQYSSRS